MRIPRLLALLSMTTVTTFGLAAPALAASLQHTSFKSVEAFDTSPTVGEKVDIMGYLTGLDTHRVLVQTTKGSSWKTVKTLGHADVFDAKISFASPGTWHVRLVSPKTATYARASSKTLTIHVQPKTPAVTTPVVTAPVVTTPVVTTTPTSTVSTSGCTSGSYVNSDGNTVCSPTYATSAPAGATAQCNDGTYSFSQHRSGTCSGHGGVSVWL